MIIATQATVDKICRVAGAYYETHNEDDDPIDYFEAFVRELEVQQVSINVFTNTYGEDGCSLVLVQNGRLGTVTAFGGGHTGDDNNQTLLSLVRTTAVSASDSLRLKTALGEPAHQKAVSYLADYCGFDM